MSVDAGHSLPDKLYFRIGEVADIVGVKPYVLRYWETEFSDIKPSKSKSGQRLYRKRDVELLLQVKELLYKKRFTIDGAKRCLKDVMKEEVGSAKVTAQAVKTDVKKKSAPDAKSVMDAKFLRKIKSDLEWCLAEVSSG